MAVATYAVLDGLSQVLYTVSWDGGPGWQPPAGTTAALLTPAMVWAPQSPEAQNLSTIRQNARNAIAANVTFLALASPTAAQVTAQVQALTRQNDGIIRLLLGALDATN